MKARRRRPAAGTTSESPNQARARVRARLEAQREEIEAAALARIAEIADPGEIADPAYVEGLRRAVPAAIEFGLATVEGGEATEPPVPVELLAQARLAARNGIALDTVLRRYFAGYSLLGFHLIEQASKDGLMDGEGLQRLTATQSAHFDRLLAAIGEEHARESAALARSPRDRRQAERIERLLAGEPVDTSSIPYGFEGWHLGVAAVGAGAERLVRGLAASFDCLLLLLRREEGLVWAWLGSRARLDPGQLLRTVESGGDRQIGGEPSPPIAVGEPATGLSGWRLTHRQALAALPVARGCPEHIARYGAAALFTAALQDELLATSLRALYLEPLEAERDGGETLRKTLRAYLSTEANASSAAAKLGISRQAVARRLRSAESIISRPLSGCLPDLDVALRLAEFGTPRA